MTRAKDISKIVTDADLSGTLDVTGAVTAGGLTVEQSGNDVSVQFNNTNNDFATATSSALRLSTTASDNNLYYGEIKVQENSADTSSTNMLFYPKVNQLAMKLNNNGDISFYEDTGTTAKLFWDASEESLTIEGFTETPYISLGSTSNSYQTVTGSSDGNDLTYRAYQNHIFKNTTGASSSTDGTERMRITSDGRVGIGTSSPSYGISVQSATDTSASGSFKRTSGSEIRILPQGVQANIGTYTNHPLIFNTNSTERMTIDANGNVGIGKTPTTTLDIKAGSPIIQLEDNDAGGAYSQINATGTEGSILITADAGNVASNTHIDFRTDGTEAMRIDSSGIVNINTTVQQLTTNERLRVVGKSSFTVSGDSAVNVNRDTDDGVSARFYRGGTLVGTIGNDANNLFMVFSMDNDVGLAGGGGVSDKIFPTGNDGLVRDDGVDLGYVTGRFDNIYATNGTIQTSDQNEKNTITDSDLGIDFIKRLTPKSYIFNGKTRTHYGLVAQDVETVLSDISKPTSGFAGFIKSDISEEQDGSQYRYGLRYTEFVAPLIQAVKDQQATIDALTARITALENGE